MGSCRAEGVMVTRRPWPNAQRRHYWLAPVHRQVMENAGSNRTADRRDADRGRRDGGCGEGSLLEDLVPKVQTVVGIDADPTILRQAAQAAPTATIINGDFLTHSFEPESFDLVAAIASTHHMDLRAALLRASELVRPGGAVVVIGIAQPATVKDYLVESAGLLCSRLLRL